MSTTITSLDDQLHVDFCTACQELVEARRRQAGKDTSGHRAPLRAIHDGIDAVLDLYLEVAHPQLARGPQPAPCGAGAGGSSTSTRLR